MHEFDADQNSARIGELLESKHWLDARFDASMILLHHIVQVLTAADPDRVLPTEIEFISHAHAPQGRVRCLETVNRDSPWLAMALQRFAEERFGGGHVPCPAEM